MSDEFEQLAKKVEQETHQIEDLMKKDNGTNEGLKACPFCGKLPIVIDEMGDEWARCKTLACCAFSDSFLLWDWNTRPIEDALRKQLEVAMMAMKKANLIVQITDIGVRNFHILDDALTEIAKIGGAK
jgi:hypothetical protein